MTDAEIIKALECCSSSPAKCGDCPCLQLCDCLAVEKDAFDLINRQKAEIERLREEKAKFDDTILYYLEQVKKIVEEAKAEAIKEFASAYKDQIKNYTGMFTDEGFYVSHEAVLSAVDFVLNRMAGDTE